MRRMHEAVGFSMISVKSALAKQGRFVYNNDNILIKRLNLISFADKDRVKWLSG